MSRVVLLLIVGMLLGGLAVWGFQFGAQASPSSSRLIETGDDARPLERGQVEKRAVFALGTLEPRDGTVTITSPLAGYRVANVLVHEGSTVKEDLPLVELDRTAAEQELKLIEAQREQAAAKQDAEIQAAQQQLAAADLAVRQATEAKTVALDAQQKQLDLAETKLKHAQEDLDRSQRAQVALTQQVEHQRTAVTLATAERDAAKSALRRLEQSLDFNIQKAEAEQRAARESVEIAKNSAALRTLDRQVETAKAKLNQTTISAPGPATVLSVSAHPGEIIATQPLLTLADLSRMVCLAEVDVADLPLLSGKHDALIRCRAFHSNKIHGRIERVRNMAGPASLRPLDPRQPVDRTVATVVIGIDAAEAARLLSGSENSHVPALMGLQVEVEIPLTAEEK